MTPTLQERLNRLPINALHIAILALAALSLSVDAADLALGNALSAVFSVPPYSVPPGPLAWMLSSIFLGAVLGAPVLGWAADRWGMRPVLVLALLWLGMTTFLTPIRSDMAWLTALRFLSGISIGALPPLLIAYLTGIAPARYRGRFIFWVCAIAYLAPPATLFGVRWLMQIPAPLGLEGWRWPFFVAGLVALGMGTLFTMVPESPQWLLAARRPILAQTICARFEASRRLWGAVAETAGSASEEAPNAEQATRERVGIAAALINSRFASVAVLYCLLGWVGAGFPVITGPVLIERGYDLKGALLYVALTYVGPSLSAFATAPSIDRLPRRTSLLVFATCMLGSIALFFGASARLWVATAVIVYGIALALYLPVLTTYAAETFPTAVRSSATSAAWAINRLASVVAPLVLIPMLHRSGQTAVGVLLCAVLIVTIVAILWPVPHRQSRFFIVEQRFEIASQSTTAPPRPDPKSPVPP